MPFQARCMCIFSSPPLPPPPLFFFFFFFEVVVAELCTICRACTSPSFFPLLWVFCALSNECRCVVAALSFPPPPPPPSSFFLTIALHLEICTNRAIRGLMHVSFFSHPIPSPWPSSLRMAIFERRAQLRDDIPRHRLTLFFFPSSLFPLSRIEQRRRNIAQEKVSTCRALRPSAATLPPSLFPLLLSP